MIEKWHLKFITLLVMVTQNTYIHLVRQKFVRVLVKKQLEYDFNLIDKNEKITYCNWQDEKICENIYLLDQKTL